MTATIGFVGVGRMGANMARRLKDQGHTVTAVYDSAQVLAAELATEIGAAHASSLAAVTAAADIVITVVTDDAAQLAVFSTEGDSLLVGAENTTFINCATITPDIHVEIEKRARGAGAHSLEACMASSIPQARQGTLYLMCAGERAVFDDVKNVLDDLSQDLRYIGPAGSAAQVKALVNMIMNVNTAALAEGLGLGAALGLDLDMLREVFSQTGANSQVLKTDGEDMQNRDHECYFSAAHAAKDSGIAWTLGTQAGLPLPLASATKLQYERLCALGVGGQDKSAVAELTFKGRLV
ncbi:NAD(P)-dependent oxidoreductase [Synoicihabitans lomoniglobus]|uniref:NAD(P)-dependent oxidoreductase n=1 Tax=Synoicihabitans lomoniglobus TaxID=2909285 RepID=A0AAF0I360_9BACT|nr:NAD(P)-dependent oxidoreductase [Opitutaceae bacterium LMO-M01]WED66927.1 NAD(P)-dependent oxidoreductase [Opitutaceae bacterium LMO-M01]